MMLSEKTKILTEYLFLWAFGGSLYFFLEVFFRGFSHWSMFLLGGVCLVFFYLQGKWSSWKDPLWLQVLRCTIFIVSCEFITGIIVNKWLSWQVWDYSEETYHLFGQICLPFAGLFAGLSMIGIFLSAGLMHVLFQEAKPEYHIL